MFIIPSPLFITHNSSSNFGEQILNKENLLNSNPNYLNIHNENQIYIDISLMFISRDNPFGQKSFLKTSLFLTFLKENPNSDISLFLGLLNLSIGEINTSILYFIKSSSNGNIVSMNLLGLIYMGYFQNFGILKNNLNQLELSKIWFSRAYRLGSIESLRFLGEYYSKIGNLKISLYYYSLHFQKTKSKITSFLIANLLNQIGKKEESIKWHNYSASNCIFPSIDFIMNNKRDNNEYIWFIKWLSLNRKYNFFKFQEYFSPLLLSNFKPDFSLPDNLIKSILHKFDFKEIQTDSSSFEYKSFPHDDFPSIRRFKNSINYLLPSNSPNMLLFRIFSFASSSIHQRNLILCETLLNNLYSLKPNGIFDSLIFREKCKSLIPSDIIETAFISFILGDKEFSLNQFLKASQLGDSCGHLMSGLILFHNLAISDLNINDFYVYLSLCPTDPIALMHLGTASNYNVWIERASQIFGCNSNSGLPYEIIGDIFNDGIILPKNSKIALMWYGLSMEKNEEFGLDNVPIIEKIGLVMSKNRNLM